MLTKQGDFTKEPNDMPDVPSPNMTPSDIRALWQTPSDELKATHNALVDELTAPTGATDLGAKDSAGATSTVQAELDKLGTDKSTNTRVEAVETRMTTAEGDINTLEANKTDLVGDHKGTWQGFTPSMADPGISSVVQQHTAQLAVITNKIKWIDPIQDYGCKGDGVTDDSINFQNALNACTNGSIINIPVGSRFLITQPLTITAGYVTIKSDVNFHGVADGNTYATGFIFKLPANSTAVTTSKKLTLIGLFAQEQGIPNGCTFLSISTDVFAVNCQFYDWKIVHSLTTSYYSKFNNCEWVNCDTGVLLTNSYNVHFVTPKFSCNTAINLGNGCKPVSVFGGSIESFSNAGGVIVQGNAQCNFYGVYWESSAIANGIGIALNSGGSVNLIGNYAYLKNINRWVNGSGTSNTSINSHGNRFANATGGTTTPEIYRLPNSGQVDISGDDCFETNGTTITYIGGSSFSVAGFRIVPPANYAGQQPIQYQGNDLVCLAHTTAPTSPTKYGLYLADGVNWNPLSKGTTQPYFVLWSGTAWISVS